MTQEMALYPDGLAFSTKQALVLIEQRGLVRPEFQATMSVDLESDVAALMPEFTSPFHVMESYLLQMESAEVLERSRGKWRLHDRRSEEHTSELQSLMRISYAVFGLKKKKH